MFFKKEKKEKNANNAVKDMITHKALLELKKKEGKIKNLEANLDVLETTLANIKQLCDNSKGQVVSKKKILKELGE